MAQPKNFIYGIHPIELALKINPWRIQEIFIDQEKWQSKSFKLIQKEIQTKQINYQLLTSSFFKKNYANLLNQGIVAKVSHLILGDKNSLKKMVLAKEKILVIMLDNLSDPHNLGAILRSSDGLGVAGVILNLKRSPPLNHTAAKVSSGAIENVSIFAVSNLAQSINEIKKLGVWIYGLDMTGKNLASYFKKNKVANKILLVVGAEGKGLSPLIKKQCDELLSIEMSGEVASLNASVSAAIGIYEIKKSMRD